MVKPPFLPSMSLPPPPPNTHTRARAPHTHTHTHTHIHTTLSLSLTHTHPFSPTHIKGQIDFCLCHGNAGKLKCLLASPCIQSESLGKRNLLASVSFLIRFLEWLSPRGGQRQRERRKGGGGGDQRARRNKTGRQTGG